MSKPEIGARVKGEWAPSAWFEGVIDKVRGDKFHVQFDDGDEAWLPASKIQVLEAAAPQVAQATSTDAAPMPGPGADVAGEFAPDAWFAGTVKKVREGEVFVRFNDGDTAWLDAKRLAVFGDGTSFPAEGTAVVTEWGEDSDSWFPGTMEQVRGDRGFVRFDDGDSTWAKADKIAVRCGLGAGPTAVASAPVQAAPAPSTERVVVEREILVVRCPYCKNLTPADLSKCRACGAEVM